MIAASVASSVVLLLQQTDVNVYVELAIIMHQSYARIRAFQNHADKSNSFFPSTKRNHWISLILAFQPEASVFSTNFSWSCFSWPLGLFETKSLEAKMFIIIYSSEMVYYWKKFWRSSATVFNFSIFLAKLDFVILW